MLSLFASIAISATLAVVPPFGYCDSCGEPNAIVAHATFDDGASGEVCAHCNAFFNYLSDADRETLRNSWR